MSRARRVMASLACLLALARVALGAPAPADDTKREDIVQMRVGEQRDLGFAGLVRFSVGDSTVLVVRRIEGDHVWVEALRPGDTWIEVVHGARAYTALRVVVGPAAGPPPLATAASPTSPHTTAPGTPPNPQTSGTPPNPQTSGTSPIPQTSGTSPNPQTSGTSPNPQTSGTSPNPQTPGTSPNPQTSGTSPNPQTSGTPPAPQPSPGPRPSPGANERALTLQENDFRFGIEPSYGVDTQVFPTLVTVIAPDGQSASATLSTRVKRQFQMIPVTFDWSPSRLDRLTAVVPFVDIQQVTSGPAGSARARASGLGDVGLTWEHLFDRRPVGGWETGVQVSTTFPTGRSVYDITDAADLPLGTGHYQVGSGLVVRRVSDPMALYATLGLNYTLPRLFNGNRISPGLGFDASTGISWAMSDRWALSEQITYARRPNIFLASPTLTVTQNVDQAYITQSVTYSSRRGDFLLRLMFSAGLNDASTDFIGGISAQWRR